LFSLFLCLMALKSDGAGPPQKKGCYWQIHTEYARSWDEMNIFLRLHPNCEPLVSFGSVIRFRCWVCEEGK